MKETGYLPQDYKFDMKDADEIQNIVYNMMTYVNPSIQAVSVGDSDQYVSKFEEYAKGTNSSVKVDFIKYLSDYSACLNGADPQMCNENITTDQKEVGYYTAGKQHEFDVKTTVDMVIGTTELVGAVQVTGVLYKIGVRSLLTNGVGIAVEDVAQSTVNAAMSDIAESSVGNLSRAEIVTIATNRGMNVEAANSFATLLNRTVETRGISSVQRLIIEARASGATGSKLEEIVAKTLGVTVDDAKAVTGWDDAINLATVLTKNNPTHSDVITLLTNQSEKAIAAALCADTIVPTKDKGINEGVAVVQSGLCQENLINSEVAAAPLPAKVHVANGQNDLTIAFTDPNVISVQYTGVVYASLGEYPSNMSKVTSSDSNVNASGNSGMVTISQNIPTKDAKVVYVDGKSYLSYVISGSNLNLTQYYIPLSDSQKANLNASVIQVSNNLFPMQKVYAADKTILLSNDPSDVLPSVAKISETQYLIETGRTVGGTELYSIPQQASVYIALTPIDNFDLTIASDKFLLSPGENIIEIGYKVGSNGVKYMNDSFVQLKNSDVNPKSTTLSIKTFNDLNENGVLDSGETVTQIPGVQILINVNQQHSYEYKLTSGWNLVSFPFVANGIKASDLLSFIAKQGGYATTVSKFQDGKWVSYKIRGGEVFSDEDFKIESGKGYMIKVLTPVKLTLAGENLIKPQALNFNTGWNLVGVNGSSKKYTAESLIDSIISDSKDAINPVNVTKWSANQTYTGLQKEKDSSGVEQVYGNDFAIDEKTGYFVRIKSGEGEWKP
jgi:hypothetical protein